MTNLSQFNKRLLLAQGLSLEVAQIVIDHIDKLTAEIVRLDELVDRLRIEQTTWHRGYHLATKPLHPEYGVSVMVKRDHAQESHSSPHPNSKPLRIERQEKQDRH